jgi:antitoxin component of MazEF toxin-antitoxin module
MARRKLGNEQVRKLQRTGRVAESYMVTLPKELIAELGWQKKQKVVVEMKGKTLVIKDWE